MKSKHREDLSHHSMLDLFRVEVEAQTSVLTTGLLELERKTSASTLENLMRAAHSLKGAARIVNLSEAVKVAHAMEDCFVAAQRGKLTLRQADVDVILRGVDFLALLGKKAIDPEQWESQHRPELEALQQNFTRILKGDGLTQVKNPPSPAAKTAESNTSFIARSQNPERVVRLAAENLNRLLGLAGESLVESRWLRPFSESLQRLKRHHADLSRQLDALRRSFDEEKLPQTADNHLIEITARLRDCQHFLSDRLEELEMFDRRSSQLSHRLYLEVLRTRMRPFSDGSRRFPRMVRDLARSLGKEVRLEVQGEMCQVDRDILERLETPLAHLLRNAVDHGCESPSDRERAGKPAEGVIRLEARHSAGMLLVTVSDDGGGVDFQRLRNAILERNLATPAAIERLTEADLLEFLFRPGFTLRDTVTELSGRGVGLDVVQNMVRSVRGTVRISNQAGRGLRIQLQLPLTLSVVRALLVEIAGEPYAIALSQMSRALKVPAEQITTIEGRPQFELSDGPLGLLSARSVLDCGEPEPRGQELHIVVVGDRSRYGLVVDRFLGERELVVQPLDPRLGKIPDISAAALMEDGCPVLIIDVEEMMRNVEKLFATGAVRNVFAKPSSVPGAHRKKVLVVDDSLTVRELQRKLLATHGYSVETVVDGMEGWNAVQTGQYDLVITDVDMPRMDGIELAALIKADPQLKAVPVMIVSYKDLEQDRLRGLEAGADYYLAKSSFHDQALVQAVTDLIGESAAA